LRVGGWAAPQELTQNRQKIENKKSLDFLGKGIWNVG
jgi:hypothetical protein